ARFRRQLWPRHGMHPRLAGRPGGGLGAGGLRALEFRLGRSLPIRLERRGLIIGGIRWKVQLAHMKLCASRAFWLVGYPSQGHEMLFDAHTRCLTGLGGVAGRGIYDNMKTAVDRTPRKDRGRVVNARFAAMTAHSLF